MKYYIIEIRESGIAPRTFIMDFQNIYVMRDYLKINWGLKKYKKRVFEIKKCVLDEISKKKK